MPRETLLIDADDTLWENNVFFEEAIGTLLELAGPLGYSHEYARHILNETELHNIRQHGYGVRCFARSLEETYVKLAGNLAQRPAIDEIRRAVVKLEQTPPQMLPGVAETLTYLAGRHRLILFSKGEAAEQAAKVERSGLQTHFEAIEIVAEKDVPTYIGIVNKHHVVKSRGWMIGNSPRSDVNPALDAGLNAVFIPHPGTWQLEHEELHSGVGRLLVIGQFGDLRQHF